MGRDETASDVNPTYNIRLFFDVNNFDIPFVVVWILKDVDFTSKDDAYVKWDSYKDSVYVVSGMVQLDFLRELMRANRWEYFT